MEVIKNETYHLELRGENVVYKGFDPEYVIKDGHGCRKGFHIFIGSNGRRFALTDEEIEKRVTSSR